MSESQWRRIIMLASLASLLLSHGCANQRDITRPHRGVTGDPEPVVNSSLVGRWVDKHQSAIVIDDDGIATITVTSFELFESWGPSGRDPNGKRHSTGVVFNGYWSGWNYNNGTAESLLPDSVCISPQWDIILTFIPQHGSDFDTTDALVGTAYLSTSGGPWQDHVYTVPIRATRE